MGNGNVGSIKINALDRVEFKGDIKSSNASSVVGVDAIGNSGGIEINANSVSIENGSFLNTTTLGKGDAGLIKITAKDTVIFNGEDLQGNPSNVSGVVGVDAIGNSGGIEINADSLFVTNGAFLDVSTWGKGTSGNIKITANNLNINERGKISIQNSNFSSETSQEIEQIEIVYNLLTLDRNSSISASSNNGKYTNINLRIRGLLKLFGNSRIFSDAGDLTSNAGNIDIIAAFIIAQNNSDITANAILGNAGNINITTQSIFGLKVGDRITDGNDITASSESGKQGIVNINLTDIDFLNGLIKLPIEAKEKPIEKVCQANNKSSSIDTRRGGLPSTPEEININNIWEDWHSISSSDNSQEE